MIAGMRTPPDEFARTLRDLRKKNGWAADRLSREVGVSKSYVGQWERGETKDVNRIILAKVADVLKISEGERRELNRLADLRAGDPRGGQIDVQANIIEALLEVESYDNVPDVDSPPADSELTSVFATAAACVLSNWAARSNATRFNPTNINWPESILQHGIVARASDAPSSPFYDYPDSPTIKPIKYLPEGGEKVFKVMISKRELEVNSYSNMAAGAYRQWLFGDLARCKDVVSRLSYWAIQRRAMSPVVWLRFRDSVDHELFGVDCISCDVVGKVQQRQLAMRFAASRPKRSKLRGTYVHIADRVDQWPRTLAHVSKGTLDGFHARGLSIDTLLGHLQIVNDALYVLEDSETWQAPWWRWDYHQPALPMTGETRDLRKDEVREDLIDRLTKTRRRIFKRIKKAPKTGGRKALPYRQDAEFLMQQEFKGAMSALQRLPKPRNLLGPKSRPKDGADSQSTE